MENTPHLVAQNYATAHLSRKYLISSGLISSVLASSSSSPRQPHIPSHPIPSPQPDLASSPWVRLPDPAPVRTTTSRRPPDRSKETRRRRRRVPRRLYASSSWGPAAPTSASGRSSLSTSPAPPPTIDSSPTSPRFVPLPLL
jgi:hypothetical protein